MPSVLLESFTGLSDIVKETWSLDLHYKITWKNFIITSTNDQDISYALSVFDNSSLQINPTIYLAAYYQL